MPSDPSTLTLEQFRRERGWSYQDLGRHLRCAAASAHRYCMPPDRADRRTPPDDVMERAFVLSGGRVTPNDYYPLQAWRELLAAPPSRPRGARKARRR